MHFKSNNFHWNRCVSIVWGFSIDPLLWLFERNYILLRSFESGTITEICRFCTIFYFNKSKKNDEDDSSLNWLNKFKMKLIFIFIYWMETVNFERFLYQN